MIGRITCHYWRLNDPCNCMPSLLMEWSLLLHRYWGLKSLNDLFCCVHHSRDSQWFSMGRTTPKIALPIEGSRPHPTHGSLGPCESASETTSQSVQPFLQSSSLYPTDRQTHRPQYVWCDIHAHAIHVMQLKRVSYRDFWKTKLNLHVLTTKTLPFEQKLAAVATTQNKK